MDLSSLIFPKEVFDNFSVVHIEEFSEHIEFYLDELSIRPEGSGHYLSKGFTPYSIVQDYPLRGRAVYLHTCTVYEVRGIRRRKWQEQTTGDVIVRHLDISHVGTHLSKEFAAFLKDAHRYIGYEYQDNRRNVSS